MDTVEAYLQWLKNDCGYLAVKSLPDDRWAAISGMIYHHDLITGRIGDYAGWDDSWSYNTFIEAFRALTMSPVR